MKTNDPRHDLSRAIVLPWAAVSTKAQDKYSIADQLKLEADWCKKHRATMLEPLVVRGFSRNYWTLADVVAAAAHDPDMEAFAKLQQHIRKRDFTVFLCFDADRFGRTESLILEVIGRVTRDCDALVYTLFDGIWMDATTAPTIGLLKAHKAQQDIARLVEYRVTGMHNRAQEGKTTSALPPVFHKRIRNEKGEEVSVVVDEDYRALWTDVATLLLRGVRWDQLEAALFNEFGHGKNGKPYATNTMRRYVLHYAFWGHAAINYRQKGEEYAVHTGPWIWDASIPAPPPVVVYRNRLPAVYSGEWAELGEQVKAELWRRERIKGRGSSRYTFRYHGLFVCAECGYTMQKATGEGGRVYVRCGTRLDPRRYNLTEKCSQRKQVRVDKIEAFFTRELQYQLDNAPSLLFETLHDTDGTQRQIVELERQSAKLQKRMDSLTLELADANDRERLAFRKLIREISDNLDLISQQIDMMQSQQASTDELRVAQEGLLDELKKHGVSWLWTLPDTSIHQRLSIALGHNQIYVRDGELRGVTPAVSSQIRHRRKHRTL